MGVHLRIGEGVAELTIDRPERRNALNRDALDELHEHVRRIGADATVRATIITGVDHQFCAGADLKELEDQAFTVALRACLDDLADLQHPVIAAISGACMGLGMQLALAADLRLATEDARFAVPVAKLGLMVDQWTINRLGLLVGPSLARWMVLTAEPVDQPTMCGAGFVHRTGDLEEARLLASRIGTLAPLALSGTKLGLNLLEARPEAAPYREAFDRAWASADLIEGRAAFAERRPPRFRGV